MATVDKNVLQKALRATTNPIRMMPTFIIIGVQKGGTTSLYRYLTAHPNIAPIYIKEPHFFDIYFHKGLPWYRAHFPTSVEKYYARYFQKHDLITGEASPYYVVHPLAAQRIAKTLPKVKLIVLLRNPIDRAYSQYQHQLRQPGVEALSFEEAIDVEEQRLAGEEDKLRNDETYVSFNHRHYSYLARSTYINQLPNWMSIFPKEQLLILKSEDLYTDATRIVQQTLEFLNVPALPQGQTYKAFNEARYSPMNPATRERLVEYFKPYNERLYEFLGRDFGWDS
jgi:hypothetical protein